MFFLILPVMLVSCGTDSGGGNIWFLLKVMLGVFVVYYVIKWFFDDGSGLGGGGGCRGGG